MKIQAKIKNFSYPIIIGSNLIPQLPDEICKFTKSKKILILIDSFLIKKYKKKLTSSLANNGFDCIYFEVKAGKKCKDLKVLLKIIDFLEKNKFSKDSTLIAFGGGTIGDLGGFAASIYYRGLNLVQIPTTLTAQIDSSIGGKVAINYNNNINAIGNYYHPRLILCDDSFMDSLSKRDFQSGLAEVIKSALISNKNHLKFLINNSNKINNRDKTILSEMISRIIKIKLEHVAKDEREKNIRMFLNYGHTIGQAIESSFSLKQEHYRHGEAVGLGMLCVSYIADSFFKTKKLYKQHLQVLKKFNLPLKIKKNSKSKKEIIKIILNNIQKDKKTNYLGVRFILLKDIGKPKIVSNLNKDLIKESISKHVE
jgi:3-dehydroquinate synthase